MDLNYDNDWYRYFGDSTVYCCRKSGIGVHLPDTGKSDSASCEQDGTETEDTGRLESDHERNND